MSFSLYSHLPNSVKSALRPLSFDKLQLANGSLITMFGTTRVKLYVPRLHKHMHVVFHVLGQTSQPVILELIFWSSLVFHSAFLSLVNVQILFTTETIKLSTRLQLFCSQNLRLLCLVPFLDLVFIQVSMAYVNIIILQRQR